MTQKSLSNMLKALIIAVAFCGVLVYFMALPVIGVDMAETYPEYKHCLPIYLSLFWLSAVTCYAVLVFSWLIAARISKGLSFCVENAKYLKIISVLAEVDTAFFFVGNLALLLFNMSHPSIFAFALLVCFIGVALTIVFGALSHLVLKAAALQEQSDLTI